MKSLGSLNSPELVLRRVLTVQKTFHLLSEKTIVGKLQYKQDDKTAIAEISEGRWVLRNTSYTYPHISIWTGNREFVAMFEVNRIGSGNLLIQDGRRFYWTNSKKLPEEWCLSNSIRETILEFLPEHGEYSYKGSTYLYPESLAIPNLGLFVLLGWFTLSVLESSRSTKAITDRFTPW